MLTSKKIIIGLTILLLFISSCSDTSDTKKALNTGKNKVTNNINAEGKNINSFGNEALKLEEKVSETNSETLTPTKGPNITK